MPKRGWLPYTHDLEDEYYDLDLVLGCGSPAPRSLHRPASPVDWLETAERELSTLEKFLRGAVPSGVIFWRRALGPGAPEILLYHSSTNLSSEKYEKNK